MGSVNLLVIMPDRYHNDIIAIQDGTTVGAMLAKVLPEIGVRKELVLSAETGVLVNGRFVRGAHVLHDGDDVKILFPIMGG